MKSTQNLTDYQKKVYEFTSKIPKGKVTTYRDLCRAVGTGSPRSTGQALKKNPFAPGVPCHRIVKADGSLGGYSGHTDGPEVERKRSYLKEEGVRFINPNKVDSDCFFTFE